MGSTRARRLRTGSSSKSQLGTNPYKFGLIGSTDAHTGLAATEEENFFGKTARSEPSPERLTKTFMANPKIGVTIKDWEVVRLGLRRRLGNREHARGDFRRDEAPRDVRDDRPAHDRALLRRLRLRGEGREQPHGRRAIGYAKGVPMGGDLSNGPGGQVPTFLVAALKDPIGANLDRIQIIKGWMDKDGKTQERGLRRGRESGGRKIDPKAAARRRSATPWTSRTRRGPTRSVPPS